MSEMVLIATACVYHFEAIKRLPMNLSLPSVGFVALKGLPWSFIWDHYLQFCLAIVDWSSVNNHQYLTSLQEIKTIITQLCINGNADETKD